MADVTVIQRVAETNSNGVDGIRLIPAHNCYYPPAVKSADLLLVDFGQREIQSPGLYLVEEIKAGMVVWMGCRRFDMMPSGIKIDADGDGAWQPFTGHAAETWRIAGYVKEVYKPSTKEAA